MLHCFFQSSKKFVCHLGVAANESRQFVCYPSKIVGQFYLLQRPRPISGVFGNLSEGSFPLRLSFRGPQVGLRMVGVP